LSFPLVHGFTTVHEWGSVELYTCSDTGLGSINGEEIGEIIVYTMVKKSPLGCTHSVIVIVSVLVHMQYPPCICFWSSREVSCMSGRDTTRNQYSFLSIPTLQSLLSTLLAEPLHTRSNHIRPSKLETG
jgi:hypothetical protein